MSNDYLDRELRKFLKLCICLKIDMPMFSKFIDNYWHSALRENTVSSFPRHDNNLKTNVPENISWVSHYEEKYGKLSDVWFMDGKGLLDERKYQKYLSTGKVVSSYNCAARVS